MCLTHRYGTTDTEWLVKDHSRRLNCASGESIDQDHMTLVVRFLNSNPTHTGHLQALILFLPLLVFVQLTSTSFLRCNRLSHDQLNCTYYILLLLSFSCILTNYNYPKLYILTFVFLHRCFYRLTFVTVWDRKFAHHSIATHRTKFQQFLQRKMLTSQAFSMIAR